MKNAKSAKIIIASILIISLNACSTKAYLTSSEPTQTFENIVELSEAGNDVELTGTETPTTRVSQPLLEEVEVVPLKLPERVQAASFEYSGLAWFGDFLVLLPQYPEGRYSSGGGNLFAISKEDILRAIEDPEFELPVRDVPIFNSNLRNVVKGFEGFESILFVEQEVYLTVESHGGNPMMGYLIKGVVEGELESITLDPNSLVELEPPSSAENATFEAITYWDGNLYVIYEHNAKQSDAQPLAYQFDLDLEFEKEIDFPIMDYRITDATMSDPSGKFWVVNYFFPGDTHLAVEQDALISQYGQGATHASNEPVERLVQLQIEKDEISRVDQAPIYLKLLGFNIARNWEGVVMLDELGFLLISDSFPGSILGFCSISS
jgi:hypothetical protein